MTDNALTNDDIDNLAQALIMLTQELWIVKDRQRVLEAALAEAGVLAPQTVDAHAPDEQLTELLNTERGQLLDNVLGSLRKTDS